MDRIIEIKIPEEYNGFKIYEFLRERGFSRQNLTDIRFKEYPLLVNGEGVFRNHILNSGDVLKVCFLERENSEHIPPVNIPIDIIYEDEDVLVVNKSAKMPIHPSLNNYENSLANAVMYYYNSKGCDFVYRCINRLDRDTSGLTLIAKNSISASILGDMQKSGDIKKVYTAIVEGEDIPEEGIVDLPIGRVDGSTIERRIDRKNGKAALTRFKKLGVSNGLSLITLQLETGRTHQIRVHMKAINHPLIGDFLYNPEDTHMDRQALHVYKLEFLHPIKRETITLYAPLPGDMRKFFDRDVKSFS